MKMIALVILLAVLLNLGFGVASDIPSDALDWSGQPTDVPKTIVGEAMKAYQEHIKMIKDQQGLTRQITCPKISGTINNIAGKRGFIKNGRIELPGSKDGEGYLVGNCQVAVSEIRGKLSPPSGQSTTSLGEGLLVEQNIKFGVNVNLFQVLFQLLMYGAGIFWLVRVARKVIEGDLSEAAIAFAQGFIIVASMYVLYRLM
jgi:hypothetical protein